MLLRLSRSPDLERVKRRHDKEQYEMLLESLRRRFEFSSKHFCGVTLLEIRKKKSVTLAHQIGIFASGDERRSDFNKKLPPLKPGL